MKRIAENNPESYVQFWKEFGKVLKEGMVEDHENQKTLAELLRFCTTHDDEETQTVSLADYVKRMPMKQKGIYFITADSYAAASTSPHLEIFRKNEIEVLLLTDPVDEWLVTSLSDYEEKPLKSIAKGALDLDEFATDDQKKAAEEKGKDLTGLVEKIQAVLSDRVKEVRVSHRLTDSPACLVADEHDLGGNLERILQAMGQDAPDAKPIMEINADHPVFAKMKSLPPVSPTIRGYVLYL